jgi:flagellar hook assembly protein FlgD
MLSRPGAVELRIVDVAGRLVRTMSENAGARSGEFWWDGMDDAGRPAGAGAFFYDVRVDGLAQGGKMTLLR